jgi:hypothetical protein
MVYVESECFKGCCSWVVETPVAQAVADARSVASGYALLL